MDDICRWSQVGWCGLSDDDFDQDEYEDDIYPWGYDDDEDEVVRA